MIRYWLLRRRLNRLIARRQMLEAQRLLLSWAEIVGRGQVDLGDAD